MVELYSLFFMWMGGGAGSPGGQGAGDGGVERGQNPHLKEPLLSFPRYVAIREDFHTSKGLSFVCGDRYR